MLLAAIFAAFTAARTARDGIGHFFYVPITLLALVAARLESPSTRTALRSWFGGRRTPGRQGRARATAVVRSVS